MVVRYINLSTYFIIHSFIEIISAYGDGSFHVYDVETGKHLVGKDQAHEYPLSCIELYDENILALGDDEGNFSVWDIRSTDDLKRMTTKKDHTDYIADIVASKENNAILCAG